MRWQHQRLNMCAPTTSKGNATAGIATSTVHLRPSMTQMPMAPYAPMRESFMIASTRSVVVPPPKPSQASAKPSSCRAPVRSNEAASMSPIDTLAGSQ